MREQEHERGHQTKGLKGKGETSQPLAPSSPSCAMSLLISTSTSGWAGSQRGGDHNSIHLKSHFMETWPLISKSGQNMCKGRAKALAQAGGRGMDKQDDIVPAQRVQRHKEPCTLTLDSHLRAFSRPCPLSPSTSRHWRNPTATSSQAFL